MTHIPGHLIRPQDFGAALSGGGGGLTALPTAPRGTGALDNDLGQSLAGLTPGGRTGGPGYGRIGAGLGLGMSLLTGAAFPFGLALGGLGTLADRSAITGRQPGLQPGDLSFMSALGNALTGGRGGQSYGNQIAGRYGNPTMGGPFDMADQPADADFDAWADYGSWGDDDWGDDDGWGDFGGDF